MTAKIQVDSKANGIDVLSLAECMKALEYSILANQPINLIGPPGVGKSAIVAMVAKKLGMPFEPLILSLCDPTDIGGFPVSSGANAENILGSINRLPLGSIKRACNEPVILFLDELTCASPAVQGAALRLVYERWAGDVRLHPGTRIVAAANPPEQASGGWELSLPLLGRMTQINMCPQHKEVQDYFYDLDAKFIVKPNGERERVQAEMTTAQSLATDFAATIEMAPDLLCIHPPPGTSSSGKAWGAPRSWERGIRVIAEALDKHEQDSGPVFAALLAGNVGDDAAASYMTIRKVRHSLPTIKEILKNPVTAKLPTDVNSAIAVLGILAQVSQTDPCPAWVYSDRLQNETRVAAMNVMGRFGMQKFVTSPFHKEGTAAQSRLLRSIGQAIRGQ